MHRRDVVTCFLLRGDKVLLVKRSDRVRTYPGKWAGISGTLEAPDAAAEALREVREETGLVPPQVQVLRTAPPLEVEDAAWGVAWRVHPVLAEVAAGAEPRLDWEHSEARWVPAVHVKAFDTVPALAAALERVLHA